MKKIVRKCIIFVCIIAMVIIFATTFQYSQIFFKSGIINLSKDDGLVMSTFIASIIIISLTLILIYVRFVRTEKEFNKAICNNKEMTELINEMFNELLELHDNVSDNSDIIQSMLIDIKKVIDSSGKDDKL